MFITLIVMIVSFKYTCVKIYKIENFKYVQFIYVQLSLRNTEKQQIGLIEVKNITEIKTSMNGSDRKRKS